MPLLLLLVHLSRPGQPISAPNPAQAVRNGRARELAEFVIDQSLGVPELTVLLDEQRALRQEAADDVQHWLAKIDEAVAKGDAAAQLTATFAYVAANTRLMTAMRVVDALQVRILEISTQQLRAANPPTARPRPAAAAAGSASVETGTSGISRSVLIPAIVGAVAGGLAIGVAVGFFVGRCSRKSGTEAQFDTPRQSLPLDA
jgi:hypothetical protein